MNYEKKKLLKTFVKMKMLEIFYLEIESGKEFQHLKTEKDLLKIKTEINKCKVILNEYL